VRELGDVYFVRGGHLIKIGWSSNVAQRFEALSSHSPLVLELLATIEGTTDDEAALHRKFSRFRVHHEWFRASVSLCRFVVGLTTEIAKERAAYEANVRDLHARAEEARLVARSNETAIDAAIRRARERYGVAC
jgi:hypothetical protein